MIYYKSGSESTVIGPHELEYGLYSAFVKMGTKNKVLIVPPDFTRFHSRAGEITSLAYKYYKKNLKDILPALGTHAPMTMSNSYLKCSKMFQKSFSESMTGEMMW